MSCELSRKHYFFSLLIDEIAYRAVKLINKRALRRDELFKPLCASTTDLIGHRLVSTGIFERTQIEALDTLLQRNNCLPNQPVNSFDVFIDVGANIGVYTTRYASKFRKTLAIEASPISFDVLKANIGLCQSPNVVPICVGASDREGTLPLNMHTKEMGWSSFAKSDCESFAIQVPLKTIDQIVEEYAPGSIVSLMKVDVEGHEANVLRGAAMTLERYKPMVLYEKLSDVEGTECEDLLRAAGYREFVTFSRHINSLGLFSKTAVYAEAIAPENICHSALICAY